MRFDVVEPGTEIPSVSHLVTRENVIKYGRLVSGFNPVHEDDEFARDLGFERIVAHGVMHINFITEMLSSYSGHPERVKKLALDFVKAVYPGDEITARGYVKEVERVGGCLRVTCEVWSENQNGVKVTDRGVAELELPAG
jgi:acyl dehydratase